MGKAGIRVGLEQKLGCIMLSILFDGLIKYCGPSWLFGLVLFAFMIGA